MHVPIIWEIPVPEVTVEELLTAQGGDYSNRPPRPAVVQMNKRMLEEASELARPVVIWKEADISEIQQEKLILKEGPVFKSKLLATVAGTADNLVLYAMTIGGNLEERIAEYNKAGKMAEAYTLDSAGSTLLAKSAGLALEQFKA